MTCADATDGPAGIALTRLPRRGICADATGRNPARLETSVFIWSTSKYYLRQSTDSYIVFSPTKYFKSQALVPDKKFMGGLLFNRKHFHANVAAGALVIWWADEPEQSACLKWRFRYGLRKHDG